MTDEQFEKFWDFAMEVGVPGDVVETGTDGFARYIYSVADGIEYRVTIEPYYNRETDEPIERDDDEAAETLAKIAAQVGRHPEGQDPKGLGERSE